MTDPDNDNITLRTEFGYASIYCKLVNRTKLVVTTPEYIDNAEYYLKVILTDNNKYQMSRPYKFTLYIAGQKKPEPLKNLTAFIIKPWNTTLKRSPHIQYSKVKVDVRLRMVTKDATLTMIFSENC